MAVLDSRHELPLTYANNKASDPRLFRGGIRSGDEALTGGTGKAVKAEPARGLAAAIEAGNRLTIHIDNLAPPIDPQARTRVVKHWRRPPGIERGL